MLWEIEKKKVLVSEIITIELAAVNFPWYDEDTCHGQSLC